MADIIALGEPMAEFAEETDGRFHQRVAGDTMNAAVSAVRQGASVGYMTALGSDRFGDRIIEKLSEEGVDTTGVMRNLSAPTGLYFITYGPDGHEFSYYRHGSAASLMRADEVNAEVLQTCRIFHVSGISQAISTTARDTVLAAMTLVHEAGGLVSYDTNLRLKLWDLDTARNTIHNALTLANVALPGLDDAEQLTGKSDPDAIADFYLGLGPRIVALTMGKDGVLVATPDRRERIPTFPVDAIDASGAGDCFDGAFLAEFLATDDPFRAARYAAAAAALSTQGHGALDPIPKRSTVEKFLKERG